MSEIEKMKRYIEGNKGLYNTRYDVRSKEILAMVLEMEILDAVMLAFSYGRAKGYRAAKAEARHGKAD